MIHPIKHKFIFNFGSLNTCKRTMKKNTKFNVICSISLKLFPEKVPPLVQTFSQFIKFQYLLIFHHPAKFPNPLEPLLPSRHHSLETQTANCQQSFIYISSSQWAEDLWQQQQQHTSTFPLLLPPYSV